jgi:hypothetical protein
MAYFVSRKRAPPLERRGVPDDYFRVEGATRDNVMVALYAIHIIAVAALSFTNLIAID